MARLRIWTYIGLLALFVAFCGCSGNERQPESPQRDSTALYDLNFPDPTFPAGRHQDTVLNSDLDGDGRPEYLVTSRSDSSLGPTPPRADLLHVYGFDTASGRYQVLLIDSLESASHFELRDLTGDGLADLVVRLDYGGNDAVVTRGMHIYSGHGASIRRVFRSSWRGPELATIAKIPDEVVLLHGELWPTFASHADAPIYVDDVMAFRDGRFRSIKGEARDYFLGLSNETLTEYQKERAKLGIDSTARLLDSTNLEPTIPLFMASALTIIYLERAGDLPAIRSFWRTEQGYLRRTLEEAEFEELEAIYSRAVER